MLLEDAEFLSDGLRISAADVAGVAVSGNQPECDLLAASPDPEWDVRVLHALRFIDRAVDRVVLTGKRRFFLGPHLVDDLARLPESPHPVPGLREAVAVRPPLMFIPSRPDPRVEPTVAGDVDCAGDL